MEVSVQLEDFDISDEIEALHSNNTKVGAIASFIGLVRDVNNGRTITGLELEHYPAMTQKALEDIVREAKSRWSLLGVRVIHRYGPLKPADQIVLVLTSSAHRGEAFKSCEFIMDYLKTKAPFWKKEATNAGDLWVEARTSDDKAASRWASG